MSSLVGRTISHYQIIDEISRGGMGVVYRALDVRLNREVALKVLPLDLVADPDRRQRFVQEARAASAIEHPHIAVIHEIDDVDGISFIAMELVRGEQLSAVTARGPLPPGRALELAGEIAEGLARAHDKNVVHRDLKPANVMLTEDGHAKVIDSAGNINLANDALYKGRSTDGLRFFEAAVATQGPKGSNQSAVARNGMARLLIEKNQPAPALEQGRRALEDAHGGGATWESLYLTARAQSRLGHDADEAKTFAELKRRADQLPSQREQRRVHQLAGLIALDRHESARAIAELQAAEAILTPGFGGGATPHSSVWFALASAELAAGNRSAAAAHLQRIVDSGRARVG